MRFDPWNPEFIANPYGVYAELRRERPVAFFEPTGQWLVARHAEAAPGLELTREPEWGPGYVIRGLRSLPVSV
ncbi:hypothetical protein SAMN05421505_12319 [Sinosporangium album]|uniref:Cytochrome P450 n=1 Tax=Sinosporangium album TaxID=504805 RepID=A0A1G8FCK6_9ACTN|nr:hypothetical protein [Sinosporangium album]SDH79782.1 hypothetical protein SAMN05421505_12319 [Sinosporangium album]